MLGDFRRLRHASQLGESLPGALFACASCILGWVTVPACAQRALAKRELPGDSLALGFRVLSAFVCTIGASAAWLWLPNAMSCVAFSLACACISALYLCDVQKRILPTGLVWALFLLAVVFRVSLDGFNACLLLLVGSGIIAVLLMSANAIHFHERAYDLIGAGDIRMIVPLVLFSGFYGTLPGLFSAAILMGALSLGALLARKAKRSSAIALAPGLLTWFFVGTLIPFA